AIGVCDRPLTAALPRHHRRRAAGGAGREAGSSLRPRARQGPTGPGEALRRGGRDHLPGGDGAGVTWHVGQSVRIATRASELALWQAHFVARSLKSLGVDAELVEVSTQGDEDQRPLSQLSGSGFFTKAVQRAVLDGDADIAVHSYKDLPSAHTPGLALGCMPQ